MKPRPRGDSAAGVNGLPDMNALDETRSRRLCQWSYAGLWCQPRPGFVFGRRRIGIQVDKKTSTQGNEAPYSPVYLSTCLPVYEFTMAGTITRLEIQKRNK